MALVVPRELVVNKSVSSLRLSEESSASNSEYARPGLSRRDTEQILDYYQSEDAGRTYISPQSSCSLKSNPLQRGREAPASARSSMRPRSAGKDFSTNAGRSSMESVSSSSDGVQRRTSQRSVGGADKRRLAIVELGARHESQVSGSRDLQGGKSALAQAPPDHNLFARRGVDSSRLEGLALVAPPDTQPFNFATVSPIPASAPPTSVIPTTGHWTKADGSSSGHHRSMSDAQSRRKGGTKASPRDVGIVGTLGTMLSSTSDEAVSSHPERQRPSTSDGDCGYSGARSGALTAPVFQTPKSRSPSPLPHTGDPTSTSTSAHHTTSDNHSPTRGWSAGRAQLTPSIGQEKEIGHPVAGPLVLDLSLGQPMVSRSPHAVTSGLPTTELPTSAPHPYTERDPKRASGRLPFKPNQLGPSFLHYQPGVHSTAGPLPSPPRHILTHPSSLPPPRPPRLLSPPPIRRNDIGYAKSSPRVTHSDGPKLPPITSLRPPLPVSRSGSEFTITAVSASSSGSDERSPESPPNTLDGSEVVQRSPDNSDQPDSALASSNNGGHVREGAFSASSVFLSHSSQPAPSQAHHYILEEFGTDVREPQEQSPSNSSSALTSSAVEPPTLRHSQGRPNLKREDSWVSLGAESFGGTSPPSSYPSSGECSTQVATTTDDGLIDRRRESLPVPPSETHRRLHSLPRTPSLLSMALSNISHSSSRSSHPTLSRKPPSSWPDSMNFHDVLVKKSAADRALAYAAKIRELVAEETGLREWLYLSTRKERRDPTPALPPATPTSRAFAKQPRHLSRGSMASEITFPVRQDSYVATDLSPRPTKDLASPISPVSALPYPSLAHGVGVRKRSSRAFATDSPMASPSGSTRSLGSGFFASIGRKASMKRDRPFPPTSPTKLISPRQTLHPPQPRPVKIGTPPTLPGGPRAQVRSAQRANSVIYTSPERTRSEAQILSMSIRTTVEATETFNLQVEKLCDLLPQADKDVLAGYLRRAANQDPMLAIGTYLEDEKQGSLRKE